MCVSVCEFVYVFECECVCVCVYLCVYVCVCVCECVCGPTTLRSVVDDRGPLPEGMCGKAITSWRLSRTGGAPVVSLCSPCGFLVVSRWCPGGVNTSRTMSISGCTPISWYIPLSDNSVASLAQESKLHIVLSRHLRADRHMPSASDMTDGTDALRYANPC